MSSTHDPGHDQAARHDPVYDSLHASDDFVALRKAYRSFVIPATVAFLSWYLLYVLMSSYATDFMSTTVVGNINVALVFGLLQFATTFLIAWLYARYSAKHLDPTARRLDERYLVEARKVGHGHPATGTPTDPSKEA